MKFVCIMGLTGILYLCREPIGEGAGRLFAQEETARREEAVSKDEDIQQEETAKIAGAQESGGRSGALSGEEYEGEKTDFVSAGEEAGGPVREEEVSGEVMLKELPQEAAAPEDGAADPTWAYEQTDESYFDNALFIGDSRTVGLEYYSGLENAAFYAATGLTVYKLFDAKIVPVEGSREKISIEEALSKRQFDKIYFMIGINELGTGTVDSFMEAYKNAVARIKELQPDAVIYVQAIMRVSKMRSDKGDYITNEGIDARNEQIAELENGKDIFYLDVNPYVCDETGGLVETYTSDGVHLRAKYIDIWKQFLMEHAVSFS